MRLNVGCGQALEPGWINIDRVQYPGVTLWDVDIHDAPLCSWESGSAEEIRCWGCLNEFRRTPVEMMSEFWRVLAPSGILDIKVAVIDNGTGAFRDPMAKRYLHSQWAEYFYIGGAWEKSGYGFGFTGKFEKISNEVSGETHHVILKAVK